MRVLALAGRENPIGAKATRLAAQNRNQVTGFGDRSDLSSAIHLRIGGWWNANSVANFIDLLAIHNSFLQVSNRMDPWQ